MRILSDHVDYWHYAAPVDPEIICDLRGRDVLTVKSESDLGLDLAQGAECDLLLNQGKFSPCYALFGGVAMPGVSHWREGDEVRYIWRAEDLEALPEDVSFKNFGIPRKHAEAKKMFCAFLDSGRRDLEDFAVDLGIICGMVFRRWAHSGHEIVVNPRVLFSNIGLEQVVPAHEVHQAISRFIGGVLTAPKEMPRLPDGVIRDKHGFDNKSFKRRAK